ncbi:hypothetical protein V5799_017339 [Amblyomma americanum]|uniref:BPTI/Kunitz inhibitor domain-containing protein n=1 Tax=Amblyomma americanum TaxID=6943 RepID=A0AAQ4F2E9_AMBAM
MKLATTIFLFGMLIMICGSDKKRVHNPGDCFNNTPPKSSKCFQRNLERWYYNQSYRLCFRFSYNGCNAGRNMFTSCQSCVKTCTNYQNPQEICNEYIKEITPSR